MRVAIVQEKSKDFDEVNYFTKLKKERWRERNLLNENPY